MWSILFAAGLLAGCTESRETGSAPEVAAFAQHDSAGIMVAEAAFPDWGGNTPWRVEPTPLLELGGDAVEGDEAFAEISAARLLPGGELLVADPGQSRVSRFAEDGRPIGSFGGEGDGPGELGRAAGFGGMGVGPGLGLDRLDDGTLLVLDRGLGVHAFDADGGFLRLERRSGTVGGINLNVADVRTVLGDGTLVLSSVDPRAGRREVGVVPPESRNFERIEVMEFAVPTAAGGPTMIGSPFVARGAVAVRSGPSPAIFVSSGQEPEIRVLDLEGQVTRILRYRLEQPDTRDFLPELRAALEARAGDAEARRARLAAFDQLDHPERVPALRSLLWDETGHLWIERFALPGEEGDPLFDILDAEGRWLGTVPVPLSPLGDLVAVGTDRILVRDRDALGSPMLRVHRLHR